MNKSILSLALWALAIPALQAATPEEVFEAATFACTDGGTLNYRKLEPAAPEAGKQYPLVLFLHGKGECGTDNLTQLRYGADLFTRQSVRDQYPAFVLFPQCPSEHFGAFDEEPPSYDATTFPVDYPISIMQQRVKELLDTYLQRDDVDRDRVYVFGLSMGGMATFDLVCRFPDVFAAAVPLCGGVNVERLADERLKEVAWRIFHGNADNTVPVENSRAAAEALQQLGADVEYIEIAGGSHGIWLPVFRRSDFLPWMFGQSRATTSHVPQAASAAPTVQAFVHHGQLTLTAPAQAAYRLYDPAGHLLLSGTLQAGSTGLTTLRRGVYLLSTSTDGHAFTQKIVY